jgi:MFS family permease
MSKSKAFDSNFALYLLGRVVSDMGTSVQTMIMPLYLIDAGGSAATVGIFSFLSLLPVLLVYPFAGVLGDRMNRKTIMVAADLVSAAVILSLALVAYLGKMDITMLLCVQIIISLLNGFFDPATRGMLPQLVPEDRLTRANSMVTSLKSLSYMLGPVVGAVLYAKFGIAVVFLVNGASFLLSGISEMMLKYIHVKREATAGIRGILSDLTQGIKFIMGNKLIRRLCYFFLALYFFVQPILGVVLPLFFKSKLAYSDTQYGYLQSIFVLGVLLGSIIVGFVFGKERKDMMPLKIGSSLIMFVMLIISVVMFPKVITSLGNSSISYFILLAGVFCLLSASNMIISIPVQTYIQKETPNEYMSRVLSLVSMISKGGAPFGALVYGIVLNRIEIHWTVLGAALLMLLISWVLLVPLLREHEN